ncbi:hypothetical protein DVA67_016375 [Solirubrobacter sp. CPCC 204708]|uniref:Fibronectin type-III domain-containing protein n=1 Tax=Solirubrobacter deserti TaxID=2282478 RepID=A0ABT4RRS9_9ACTN|nr:hypothetical protein [Solirubrobacter deserti]MBE2317560.1 hypothetical protein [Solirubrobacter deserti]MDA0141254.1 hypothetical protein [Solirubrobacter deserti]
MIRLNTIGAAVFALATLALPTFALPQADKDKLTHLDTRGQLQDVNLAEVVVTAQAAADGGDGLPTAWCGEDRTSDNTANAVTPPSKPQFKVVYAFAADRPNRFAGWRDAIQANVAIVQRFLSAQGGGTKAIRFDMGTSCGAGYVDIQIVPLPGTRAQYADNFGAISGAVQRALGTAGGPRNAIVIADGLAGGTQEYGLGETIMGASGEKPGSANVHNRGGLTSILFSRDGAAAPGAARWGWWPEGFLHEMTHNLGAVQWGAPHSTQPRGGSAPNYGHCWQGADVMCYVEDAGAAHAMQVDCSGIPGAIAQNYDCGRDDYFNPAPAPGSYLATHWNTYESVFLAPCGEIAPACGGGANWVPQSPAATSPPTVSGATRRGSTLNAGAGAWTNGPTRFQYQWQRLAVAGWEDIDAETDPTYTVTSDDLGRRLRVTVVATNPDGSAAAASNPTSPVGAAGVNRAASKTSKKTKKKTSVKAKTSTKKKKASAKKASKNKSKAKTKTKRSKR